MKSFFRLCFVAAIFGIAMVSCKGDKETTVISVSDVSISIQGLTGNTLTLTVDNEVTVTVSVTPPDATNKGVTLESGDKTVLSVTETASLTWTIKALKAGSTTLTATAKDGSGKEMTINVTVNAAVSPDATLVSIAVSGEPAKKEYQLNEQFNPEGITVTATYSDNSTKPVPFADLVFDAEFSKTAGTNKTVKVSFTYKGVTKTADITGITVSGTNGASFVTGSVAAVAASGHFVIIKTDGSLWAWGNNTCGQLGDGTNTNRDAPVQIGTDKNWKAVATGDFYTVALKTDGSLWAWGDNFSGQLGDGTITRRNTPVRITTESDWKAVYTGMEFTVALKNDGSLWAWGDNNCGQMGDDTYQKRNTPKQTGTDKDWETLTTGNDHVVAVKTDGSLWAWGSNNNGQLGDGGPIVGKKIPVRIGSGTNWKIVAAGSNNSFAIQSDGSLWGWGRNNSGQLGLGNHLARTTPIRIGSDTNWETVSASSSHTVALKKDGTLWGWGWNGETQLGDVTSELYQDIPAKMSDDTNWKMVCAGEGYTFAIRTDGNLWCWGGKSKY